MRCWVSIPVWFDWEKTATAVLMISIKFQFQYGSIGRLYLTVLAYLHQSFNSSMVRLGGCETGEEKLYKLAVSIPVWFDWE